MGLNTGIVVETLSCFGGAQRFAPRALTAQIHFMEPKMAEILNVDEKNYDEVVLKNEKPVILALGASWCGDCRRARPFYERMAQDYEGRLVFASADSDACPNLKKGLGVQHIPTMVIFKNGKPLDGRLVEVKTPSELKAFIDAGLAA